uniref:Adhesion G protein-coupled receptor E1 n=1 Tax=Monodelphis domestica TaxID=13616 RepID=F7A4B8_MONDO
MVCQDVDECSQIPNPCGLNTNCINVIGSYKCSCLPGFSSPSGNSWLRGATGSFQCTDIDECLNATACLQNSACWNTPGSYNCICNGGFTFRNSQCEDVDECLDPTACPEHATCTNGLGNYFCTCNRGYKSNNGEMTFRGQETQCNNLEHLVPEELHSRTWLGTKRKRASPPFWVHYFRKGVDKIGTVDRKPTSEGLQSVLPNEMDLSELLCFILQSSSPKGEAIEGSEKVMRAPIMCKADLVDQEQMKYCQSNSTHPVLPKYIPFCMLMNSTFNVLEDTCENKTITVSLQKAAGNFASVLKETSTWHKLSQKETSTVATVFLDSVESATLAALASPSGKMNETVTTEYLEIRSKVIQEDILVENVALTFSVKGDSMKIESSTIKESVSSGILSVAFVSFLGMESILNEAFFYNPEPNMIRKSQKLWINSRVVGGIITGSKKDNLSNPVFYTLENIQASTPKKKLDTSICVSWDPEIEGGRWTPTGCMMLDSTETHTMCSCNRLANMAIIMASGKITMDFALSLISHVGLILSLLCLAMAIATFLLCRSIQNRNTTLHLHLCVCLFLAKLLFLIGADKTENKTVCAVIAGLLHYLFLACFAWMLVEAVMLFLMVRNLKVVNYFSSRNIKMPHLCAFGYGLPGLIVAVAAGIQWEGYGMHNRCWLNTDTGFAWSFLGPVCIIITINSILLTWTLWILRKKLSSVNAEVSTLKDSRLLTFKAFVQLFILGCSWILGIFQIGPIATIMAYLFTIINSLQGTFIFIIHCILNRQVREEYKRCFIRKTKSSATSQTSGILLSSVPSTSKAVRDPPCS